VVGSWRGWFGGPFPPQYAQHYFLSGRVADTGERLSKTATTDQTNNPAVLVYGANTPNAPMAPLGTAGGSQPHENRMPYLVMNYCIALVGIFPSRN